MKLILFGLLGAIVLISGASMNLADAKEMKTVPFWWSVNPITGESEYTDYFKQSSTVLKEHNAYLQSSLDQNESSFSPLVMAEVERSGMTEVITYETKWIKVSESQFNHGPFANPDYVISEKVAVSTWIETPVVVEVVIEEITEDVTEITPESVTDITAIITDITGGEQETQPVSEPTRVTNNKGNTHWDVNDADYAGSNSMSSQEFKDMKKKHEEWKAYELASKLMPNLYPPYVHEYEHEEVVVDDKIVVPLYESEVIIDIAPEITLPSVTSSAIVVPIPEPIVEPTPVPEVTSSVVVPAPEVLVAPVIPEAISIIPQITEPIPDDLIVVPLD